MRINIKDIGENGLRFSRKLDAEQLFRLLDGAVEEIAEGAAEASIDVALTLMGDTVFLRGSMSGSFWMPCSRCLGPAEVRLDEPELKLTFFPRAALPGAGEAELELDPDDLDTYGYVGEVMDLGELLREHLVLAIPLSLRCREDCAGLEGSPVQPEPAPSGLTGWQTQLKSLKDRMDN